MSRRSSTTESGAPMRSNPVDGPARQRAVVIFLGKANEKIRPIMLAIQPKICREIAPCRFRRAAHHDRELMVLRARPVPKNEARRRQSPVKPVPLRLGYMGMARVGGLGKIMVPPILPRPPPAISPPVAWRPAGRRSRVDRARRRVGHPFAPPDKPAGRAAIGRNCPW